MEHSQFNWLPHKKSKFTKFDVFAILGRFSEHLVDRFLSKVHAAPNTRPIKLDHVDLAILLSIKKLENVF